MSSFRLFPRSDLPARWLAALQAAPAWRGLDRSAFRVFARRTTPHTAVRGLEVLAGPAAGTRCWLKVYRRTPADAGREFAFLHDTERRCADDHPPAARALAWLPEIGGLVTAHLEGPTLATRLDDASVSPAERVRLCRQVGALLARLHQAPAPAGPPLDFSPVLAAIRRELDEIAPALRGAWSHRLDGLAAAITAAEGAPTLTHGDFAPFNLIVTPTGLVAFDPSFHQAWPRPDNRSATAEDLARFAVTLRGLAPETDVDPVRRRLIAEFFSAYREAGGAPVAADSPACHLFSTYFLLRGLRDWGDRRLRVPGARARAPVLQTWFGEPAAHAS